MQGIFAPLAVKFIIPNLTDDQALAMDSARAVTGQRIEALPVPVGDRYVPYNDELPAKPLQKTSLMVNSCFAGFQLLLSMAAYVPLCTLVSGSASFEVYSTRITLNHLSTIWCKPVKTLQSIEHHTSC
jgi:hypothetical protein